MVRKNLATASLKEEKSLASGGSCMTPAQGSDGTDTQCPKYCLTSSKTYGLKL